VIYYFDDWRHISLAETFKAVFLDKNR